MPLSSSTSLLIWTTAALALIIAVAVIGQLDLQALAGLQFRNLPHIDPDMTTLTTNSSAPPYPTAYPQLVLFGDSITQGAHSAVIPKLSELYLRRLDIVNRGLSGYNTLHALPILPLLFPPSAPHAPRIALLTVFFGANDAVLPGNAQHVSLHEYKSYLRQIATHPGVQHHGTKVILITPPPIDEWRFPDEYLGRNAQNTKLYADACAAVAKEVDVPFVNIWTAFMARAGWTPGVNEDEPLPGSRQAPRNEVLARLLSDGLHFTNEGYAVFYEELIKVIQAQLPDMAPDKLPMVVPDWKVVMGVED